MRTRRWNCTRFLFLAVVVLALCILTPSCLWAGENGVSGELSRNTKTLIAGVDNENAAGDKWKFEIVPAVWMPTLDAKTTIGKRTANLVLTPSKISGKVDSAYTGRLEARRGKWGISADLYYIDIKDNTFFQKIQGRAKLENTIGQVAGLYRVSDLNSPTKVDLLAGIRYNSLDMNLRFTRLNLEADKKETWVDPIIGARARFPLSKNLDFDVYGDMGGFGAGSKFSWRANAGLDWKLSEGFSLMAGWTYLDIDYEKGSGLDKFKYDATMSGPVLGAGFKF